MKKKTLIYSSLIAFLSVSIAIICIIKENAEISNNAIGKFLFEKTNQEGVDVHEIKIKSHQIQVSLYYENKFWKIKEADGYFADLVTLNQLFLDISQSKIEAIATDITEKQAEVEISEDKSGFEITTYNGKGQILDTITIGKKKNNFSYAKIKGQKDIYLVSGNFELSDKLYHWLQQPLISILPRNIESVIMQTNTGQQLAFRISEKSPFFNIKQEQTNITPLLDKFVLFNFRDVKRIQNTVFENKDPQKIIVLFPYSGLIYGIEIFNNEEKYWVKIDLSISKLPTKFASDYIKDSLFLYEGWIFQIESNLGKYLMEYKIN